MPDAASPPKSGRSRSKRAAHGGMAALTLGALGVVFGDIGTSPLYAVQTVFTADNAAVHTGATEVYGVISLIFWSITMIVSIKYVTFIMRADNGGEGGIMALTALVSDLKFNSRRAKLLLITLGIAGASLFYGDGVITPAISVLSAVEGVQVVEPSLSSVVLPITIAVLTALFVIQRFGSGLVGRLFGPVMVFWFTAIGVAGAAEIVRHPSILQGLSPTYGVEFFLDHGLVAYVALGSVVLAVTGAEALYADMGHFGREPIRRAWFLLVFPALTLNYLAQGSLIIRSPASISNPFFLLLPSWARVPMIVLATLATVIASQSVISGAFSVTRQAVRLGFLPRMTIRHTSQQEEGQVYTPAINWGLYVIVVLIVLGFGSSAALASAYGVAVTGTFILNTVLFLAVARLKWHVSKRRIVLGAVAFLFVEILFFTANLTKIVHGGWLPLALGLIVFTVLMTWRQGHRIVTERRNRKEGPLEEFVKQIDALDPPIHRIPGTAVFLNGNPETTPLALRANVTHNGVMHNNVIMMALHTEPYPHVPEAERLMVDELEDRHDGIIRLIARFGFQDETNVPDTLQLAVDQGLLERPEGDAVSYFLSRITITRTGDPGMWDWQKRLFLVLSHNAASPVTYFCLPDNRTVILGENIEI